MKDVDEIPTPDRSGSSGTQISADPSQILDPARPFGGTHITAAIEGLAANRALGGNASSVMMAAVTNQLSQEVNDLKAENRRHLGRIDELRDVLQAATSKNAVLEERLNSEGRNKHLRNLALTAGTSLLGAGFAIDNPEFQKYSIGMIGFGLALVALGWFTGPGGSKK